MKIHVMAIAAVLLAACSQKPESPAPVETPPADTAAGDKTMAEPSSEERLQSVLAAMPAETQARYVYRHPQQTLEFIGVEPGMTVIEGLPGGGWYSKVLIPYLGSNGKLIGVDYAQDMFPLFGFFSDEALEAKKTWVEDWVAEAGQWRGDDGAAVDAFVFGSMPERFTGTADVVLMIRALHNLNRFESEGGYRTAALKNAFDALKPGGILGIVQHQAADDMPDEWADGSAGYLKKSAVIEAVQAAGFEMIGQTDINANPADQPTTKEIVWRLPPFLSTSADNEELRAKMIAIGESDRMTLKFRKPE